jgi:prolyl 4-hydroxylase
MLSPARLAYLIRTLHVTRFTQAATHSRRKLSLSTADEVSVHAIAKPTAEEVAALPAIDPLDPTQLEQYMLESSGLLKVRPPLPPAKSGDNFYHAIPFQAS